MFSVCRQSDSTPNTRGKLLTICQPPACHHIVQRVRGLITYKVNNWRQEWEEKSQRNTDLFTKSAHTLLSEPAESLCVGEGLCLVVIGFLGGSRGGGCVCGWGECRCVELEETFEECQ